MAQRVHFILEHLQPGFERMQPRIPTAPEITENDIADTLHRVVGKIARGVVDAVVIGFARLGKAAAVEIGGRIAVLIKSHLTHLYSFCHGRRAAIYEVGCLVEVMQTGRYMTKLFSPIFEVSFVSVSWNCNFLFFLGTR